jgi:hypothetical protein
MKHLEIQVCTVYTGIFRPWGRFQIRSLANPINQAAPWFVTGEAGDPELQWLQDLSYNSFAILHSSMQCKQVRSGLHHTHTLRYEYATLPYVRCPALMLHLLETIVLIEHSTNELSWIKLTIPIHEHIRIDKID